MAIASGIGKFQEKGPFDRNSRSGRFFRHGIEIGHESITFFDEPLSDGFGFRPSYPRFLIAVSLLSVAPLKGLEGADFEPFCKQVQLRCSRKSSDIGPGQRETTQAKVFNHRSCHAKVIPRTAVVSCPGGSETLSPCIRGTREY